MDNLELGAKDLFLHLCLIIVFFCLKTKKISGVISEVVIYPKIVVNLSRTFEKLHRKGEPYRFSGQRDTWIQTNGQTDIVLFCITLYR